MSTGQTFGLNCLREPISRVLKLIRAFLNAGVMEDGLVRPVDEGTPQGGPLSPILSNLVLDDLDKELARRGHRFCRYADDCNIYVRSRRAGERVMASVSRFLTNKLRLKVNEAKSAVARPEERKFLGFSISNDGSERRIAPKALDKFKGQIRDMTRRTRGFSLQQLIKELKPYIVGWRGYFGFCQTPRVLTNLEAWIRRRLRLYLWRQWRTGQNRFKELRHRGISKFNAAVAAGSPTGIWRMSGHPSVQQAQQGWAGKNNVDDIIAIRALAFDVDITKRPFDNALLIDFVDNAFTGALRPSLLISTGGGFQIIYILENAINAALFRPSTNDEQSQDNDKMSGGA